MVEGARRNPQQQAGAEQAAGNAGSAQTQQQRALAGQFLAIRHHAGNRRRPQGHTTGGVGQNRIQPAMHQSRKGDEAAAASDRIERAGQQTGAAQQQ